MPEVSGAFSPEMSPEDFQSKYGFPKPGLDIKDNLVITCRFVAKIKDVECPVWFIGRHIYIFRSGRRVGLALVELEKLGYHGLR